MRFERNQIKKTTENRQNLQVIRIVGGYGLSKSLFKGTCAAKGKLKNRCTSHSTEVYKQMLRSRSVKVGASNESLAEKLRAVARILNH